MYSSSIKRSSSSTTMSKLIRSFALCMLMVAVSGTGCNCAPNYAAAPAPTYAAPAPAPVYKAPAPAPVYAAPAPAPAVYEDDDYPASNYYYNTNFNPIYSMNGGRGAGGKKANRPGWLGLIPGRQDNNGIKTNFRTSYGGKGVYTSEYSSCLSNDQNKNRGVNLVAILNGCGAGLGRR